MRTHCGLTEDSVLVDIGTGLGRPLLHALYAERLRGAFGVEVDPIKCEKATHLIRQVMKDPTLVSLYPNPPVPSILCGGVEQLPTLDPATHAYSFWEGVPQVAREAFGTLFRTSSTAHTLAVVQRHASDITGYLKASGFGSLELVTRMPVKMSGSGRSFQAYVLRKPHWEEVVQRVAARPPVPVPASTRALEGTQNNYYERVGDTVKLEAGSSGVVGVVVGMGGETRSSSWMSAGTRSPSRRIAIRQEREREQGLVEVARVETAKIAKRTREEGVGEGMKVREELEEEEEEDPRPGMSMDQNSTVVMNGSGLGLSPGRARRVGKGLGSTPPTPQSKEVVVGRGQSRGGAKKRGGGRAVRNLGGLGFRQQKVGVVEGGVRKAKVEGV